MIFKAICFHLFDSDWNGLFSGEINNHLFYKDLIYFYKVNAYIFCDYDFKNISNKMVQGESKYALLFPVVQVVHIDCYSDETVSIESKFYV